MSNLRHVAWLVSALAACLSLSALTANAALGQERQPFRITEFAMEPSETTRVIAEGTKVENGEVTCFPCRVENVPYPQPFTQAGGRPWGLAVRLTVATENLSGRGGEPGPTQDVKNIITNLPPGLLGNPQAAEHCSPAVVLKGELCPPSTQVGVADVKFLGNNVSVKQFVGPVVNLTPEAGQSAEFGLENESKFNTLLTAHLVHTREGYGVATDAIGVPGVGLVSAEVTIWGVPADSSHDRMRGMMCSESAHSLQCRGGNEPAGVVQLPFLSMPTGCTQGPELATINADSWQEPNVYSENQATLPAVTGCDSLRFNAGTGIELTPETRRAEEPVGTDFRLTLPQDEQPDADVTPQLRRTVVTLPQGMSVSPEIVNGIEACEASGPNGIDIPTGLNSKGEVPRPGEPGEGEELGLDGQPQLAPGHCPHASIVGEAEAFTPLLNGPVKGHVYLAKPQCGGPGEPECTEQDAVDGKLYRLYLELGGTGELADAGIQFKVPFDVEANPATGQLTAVVQNIVQAPVSEVRVRLNGDDGTRAALVNPLECGLATTSAELTPWSAAGQLAGVGPIAGTPVLSLSSRPFEVEGCTNPMPFTPDFHAGTVVAQAGQFSSFVLDLTREDREQYVKGIQVHTPPGLLGVLANVPLCQEPDADDGACPPSSMIGTTRVSTGAGSNPFEIEGQIYLTGPYEGAPFGLSVVTHATAGPFNLGLVVVRARITIDAENSTLTVATDESGPYAIPQIIFGVPLRLRRVSVDVSRPSFMLNPTNCHGQQIQATIAGSRGAQASVSSASAVAGCRSLSFKPKFTASTSAHTSRKLGASLDVKLSYPAGSLGTEADIARVKVDLPKQLPSRLTTLQQACSAKVFSANPVACPAASVVGVVRASTPLLPVALSGPVYFVSHGGEAFPSLVVVLQGDGVRVDLTGSTFISKGITSSTFKSAPDVPVNTFELYLPEGRYSALAANGNLCRERGKLKMPTEFVAQNGIVLKQDTKITVNGCPKVTIAAKRSNGVKPNGAPKKGKRR